MNQPEAQTFIEKMELALDDLVNQESDDLLFIGGYLRGHIMLSAGYLEMDNALNSDDLIIKTNQSLAIAIEQGELNEQDQQLLNDLWLKLCQLK